jgi:hypothetical protein
MDDVCRGYFRGRIARGGRMLLDVNIEAYNADEDSHVSDTTESELTDDIDLDLIDLAFRLDSGDGGHKYMPFVIGQSSHTLDV